MCNNSCRKINNNATFRLSPHLFFFFFMLYDLNRGPDCTRTAGKETLMIRITMKTYFVKNIGPGWEMFQNEFGKQFSENSLQNVLQNKN